MVKTMNTIEPNTSGRKPGQTAVISSVDPSELLDAKETAALLRQKPQTLAGWRCESRGPEYIKVGRSVYYRREAISTWLAGQIVRPSAA
jgi:hypothetical protein